MISIPSVPLVSNRQASINQSDWISLHSAKQVIKQNIYPIAVPLVSHRQDSINQSDWISFHFSKQCQTGYTVYPFTLPQSATVKTLSINQTGFPFDLHKNRDDGESKTKADSWRKVTHGSVKPERVALRKYSFSVRTINSWDKLPKDVERSSEQLILQEWTEKGRLC
jgi:hypothetical protein